MPKAKKAHKNSTSSKLTAKQEAFCQFYAISGNAADSYRKAGYASVKLASGVTNDSSMAIGRLLKDPRIVARIAEIRAPLLEAQEITKEKVMKEIASIAFSDIGKLFDEDGALKHPSEVDEKTRRALSAIDMEELYEGKGAERISVGMTKKVKLWDKVKALEMLAKHFQLYSDAPVVKTEVKVGYGKEDES
jgi:phage terminase small subunit